MSERGKWNRAARQSGGDRKAVIQLPRLSCDDVAILAQEAAIRKEFGEEGVRRFWEEIKRLEGD